jgi:hypothetical protein
MRLKKTTQNKALAKYLSALLPKDYKQANTSVSNCISACNADFTTTILEVAFYSIFLIVLIVKVYHHGTFGQDLLLYLLYLLNPNM